MRSISSVQAKQKFGELIDHAQHGPVTINKHGRGVAVMVSAQEYEQIEQLKREALRAKLEQAAADVKAGRLVDGEKLMAELRGRVQAHGEG